MAFAKILVADDDRASRGRLQEMLVRQGHAVQVAGAAGEALAALRSERFDLLIADGIELLRTARELEPGQEVVLVSQQDDARAAVRALGAGAADYLPKPVQEGDLLLAVERSLDRALLRREHQRLLDENLGLLRSQALFSRGIDLFALTDLGRLQERALEELAAACDTQSGALWLVDERGDYVLQAYRGLVDRSALKDRMGPPSGTLPEWLEREMPSLARAGDRAYLVPLDAGPDRVGVALLCDKLHGAFRPEDRAVARAVGELAGAALGNARRYQALERVGMRDLRSGAYSSAYFADFARKELYKARRYGRCCSLLTLALDGLPALRSKVGADVAQQAVRGLVEALGRLTRDSDVVAQVGEDELALVLPDTDHFGALVFARRAQATVREDPALAELEAQAPLAIAFGQAAFPRDGGDLDQLLAWCRRSAEAQRQSLYRRLALEGLDFWATVELLVGEPGSPRLPASDEAGFSRRGYLPPSLFSEVQREMALEISRDGASRGLLYVGCPELNEEAPVLKELDASGTSEAATRVYLLGRRGAFTGHPRATAVFVEGDDKAAHHEFLLMLGDRACYALLQRPATAGPWGFHTSEEPLIEALVAKLQSRYDLHFY